MAHEQLKRESLSSAVSDIVADLADLVQKEIKLVRAELSAKLASKLQAGIWMSAAGVLALVAALLVVQALVFAIASFGLALHWSCLIVALILAGAAALAYYKGRANADEALTPARTIQQIKLDIATVKEQLT